MSELVRCHDCNWRVMRADALEHVNQCHPGKNVFFSYENDREKGTILVRATDKTLPTNDPVSHPSHYTQGGIECLDAIEAAVTGLTGMDAVLTAQVLKYMWRWKRKNGRQDLLKAKFYLDRLIEDNP